MARESEFFKSYYQLLNSGIYEVPSFQRAYRWRPATALRLWTDCHEQWNTIVDSDEGGTYILGSTVLCQLSPEAPLSIVDGQQRIVTLWLFFRAMYFWCMKHLPDHSEVWHNVKEAANGNLAFCTNNLDRRAKNRGSERRLRFHTGTVPTIDAWFEKCFGRKILKLADWDELLEVLCERQHSAEQLPFVNNFLTALYFLFSHYGKESERWDAQACSGNVEQLLGWYKKKYMGQSETFRGSREDGSHHSGLLPGSQTDLRFYEQSDLLGTLQRHGETEGYAEQLYEPR